MNLQVKDRAHDFSAPDENGKVWSLADYRGKWLLLYFYPRDFTPGCTTEACEFRDAFTELKKVVTVVGVSTDSVASHHRFVTKYTLPFTLLSDHDKQMSTAFGTNNIIFAKRTSFLISPEGVIMKIYQKVRPKEHARTVLSDVRAFQKK